MKIDLNSPLGKLARIIEFATDTFETENSPNAPQNCQMFPSNDFTKVSNILRNGAAVVPTIVAQYSMFGKLKIGKYVSEDLRNTS